MVQLHYKNCVAVFTVEFEATIRVYYPIYPRSPDLVSNDFGLISVIFIDL